MSVTDGTDEAADDNGTDAGHPAWCSPSVCYDSEGTRVHLQALTRWEDQDAELAFESPLVDPDDDPNVYVELSLRNLRLTWANYFGHLRLEVARRLRDQLTAHLDAVSDNYQPRGYVISGGCGCRRPIEPSGRVADCGCS